MAIFSATLGLSPPWQVTEASFGKGTNRLDLIVEYGHGSPVDCPSCGAREIGVTADSSEELWYHEDFLRYATYLHARVPVLKCCCGCNFSLERPWSRAGSRFARLR